MERLYEGLFLVDSAEAAKSWSDLEGHIKNLFTKHGAQIEYTERWSDKKLAYPVKGVTKGTYFLTYFRAPTKEVNALRRDAELSERILRLLITQEEWTEQNMNKRRDDAALRAQSGPVEVPAPSAESGDASAPVDEVEDAAEASVEWSESADGAEEDRV